MHGTWTSLPWNMIFPSLPPKHTTPNNPLNLSLLLLNPPRIQGNGSGPAMSSMSSVPAAHTNWLEIADDGQSNLLPTAGSTHQAPAGAAVVPAAVAGEVLRAQLTRTLLHVRDPPQSASITWRTCETRSAMRPRQRTPSNKRCAEQSKPQINHQHSSL